MLIGGDVVDGVGIYPNQNKDFCMSNHRRAVRQGRGLLDKIPKNVKIIIMPGNHDPGRRALPQPAIPKNTTLASGSEKCHYGGKSRLSP